MREEKEDRRVRRTKKQIEEAMLTLLRTKHFQKITVKELAEAADITRATFYQHYSDPYEVLEKMQREIMVNVQEIINTTTGGDSMGFFRQMFEYLATNDIQAEILSFDTGNGTGYEYIGNCIHNNYMLRWEQKFPGNQNKQYEYYRYYIVFGCIAVVENWIRMGKKETPVEMANIAFSLLPKEKMYLKPE